MKIKFLSRLSKYSLTYRIVLISLFSILLINSLIYQLQPFTSNSIFEYYTTGYFSFTTSIQHIIFGFLPISLGDIFYIILFFIVVIQVLILIYSLIRWRIQQIVNISTNILLLVLMIWFLLGSQWNWNYSQPSLESKLDLDSTDYSVEELADFTKKLISETKITKDGANFDVFSDNTNSIIDMSYLGYKVLAKDNDFFNYSYPSIKYSLFSTVLPYLGISGYYNPFTSEAQITKGIPIVQIPFVINHEIAHQLGIASEAEANFIGYIASINNPLSTIKYSGNVNLLMYCLSDLRKRDYQDYDSLIESIPQNIKEDMNEISLFWGGYINRYRKHFDKGYDKFLKSNNQVDGLKSYNKVVSLAIFYNRKK